MPRFSPLMPRQMLPPPTTIAISTPSSRRAAATSSAMRCTTAASMPKPLRASANASPESLSTTRPYWLRCCPPSVMLSLRLVRSRPLRPRPARGGGSGLADLDAREAAHAGIRAETLHQLGDGGLRLLDEPLLEEHVV